MLLISFIITYFNEPLDMLHECINSIHALKLERSVYEIIVVDDGSKESPQTFLSCLDKDIVCLSQKNQGLSVARNNGISAAHGEYLQFIDSDDTLIAEVYNDILSQIKSTHVDMLMYRFTHDATVACHNSQYLLYNGTKYLTHHNLRTAACCYIFRKEILGGLRFKVGIYHEDALFTPQLMLRARTLSTTKSEAYFYRQHPGTIMSTRDVIHIQRRLDDSVIVLKELQQLSRSLIGKERQAIERCIDQQVMVYIYYIVVLTHSYHDLRHRTSELRAYGMFPMPLKRYTYKYLIFALATRLIF